MEGDIPTVIDGLERAHRDRDFLDPKVARTSVLPRTSKVIRAGYFWHVGQKCTADAYGRPYLMAHPMDTPMTHRGTFHTFRPEWPTERTFGVAKRLEGYSPVEKLTRPGRDCCDGVCATCCAK